MTIWPDNVTFDQHNAHHKSIFHMIHDPELKAMADVYEALKGLDADTQKRVADWVLNKLRTMSGSAAATPKTKRGRKPGAKKAAKKAVKATRKTAKKAAKKATKKAAAPKAAKKAAKRGRPAGATKKAVAKKTGRRGRPPGKAAKAAASPEAGA